MEIWISDFKVRSIWSSGFELYVRLCLVVMSIKVTLSVQNSQFLGFLSYQTELDDFYLFLVECEI